MTKPSRLAAVAQRDIHDRPTQPAPPLAQRAANNACRAHAEARGLPSQAQRRRAAEVRAFSARIDAASERLARIAPTIRTPGTVAPDEVTARVEIPASCCAPTDLLLVDPELGLEPELDWSDL